MGPGQRHASATYFECSCTLSCRLGSCLSPTAHAGNDAATLPGSVPSHGGTAASLRHYAAQRSRYVGAVLTALFDVLSERGVAWLLTGTSLVNLVRYGAWDYVGEDFVDVSDGAVEATMLFPSPAVLRLQCKVHLSFPVVVASHVRGPPRCAQASS